MKNSNFGKKCNQDLFILSSAKIVHCSHHGNKLIPYIICKIEKFIKGINDKKIQDKKIQDKNLSILLFDNLDDKQFIHFEEEYYNLEYFSKILDHLLEIYNLRIIYRCCGGKGICIEFCK